MTQAERLEVVRGKGRTIMNKTAIAPLFALAVVPAQTAQVTRADITNTEIQAALEKTASLPVSDQQLRMVSINGEYNVGAALVHRAKTAGRQADLALAHSLITEVYYIISGNGTLVTEGALEDAKDVGPSVTELVGPSSAGPKILNGKSHQVGPGDMIIIPANTPHTFTEITTDQIVYMVVRVDPKKVLHADQGSQSVAADVSVIPVHEFGLGGSIRVIPRFG
jgi:mannose-6-phosphate isomerase-like protein (cupin superfamily)